VSQFLSQRFGERVYSDSNGQRLDAYLFENESELVKASVRREITLGLTRNEPRLTVEAVLAGYIQSGDVRYLDIEVVWSFRGKTYATRQRVNQI